MRYFRSISYFGVGFEFGYLRASWLFRYFFASDMCADCKEFAVEIVRRNRNLFASLHVYPSCATSTCISLVLQLCPFCLVITVQLFALVIPSRTCECKSTANALPGAHHQSMDAPQPLHRFRKKDSAWELNSSLIVVLYSSGSGTWALNR